MAEGKYTAAQKIIDERRQKAIAAAAEHVDEVERKIPQIKNYRAAKKRYFASASAAILRADKTPAEKKMQLMKLQTESETLQRSIEDLLLRNGYPANYLEENFYCKRCNDTGFVNGMRCVCLENLARSYAAKEFSKTMTVKLPDLADFSIDYYSPTHISPGKTRTDREQMQFIHSTCVEYAENFTTDPPTSLFFTGATGLGKTFLSLAIAKAVLEQGVEVLYVSALDLFRELQDDYYNAAKANALTLEQVLQAPLLIIDDLGSEYFNQFVPSALFNIIESRLNHGRPTIINTNLSAKEIEDRYAQRVYSRIFTLYRVYPFVGSDVRVQRLKNGEIKAE